MKDWFVSDPHFYHANIIKYCNRPFKDVAEMNAALIKNWNSKVGHRDRVYLLGDVSFAKAEDTEKIFKQLNGIIYLIRGNHDKDKNINSPYLNQRFVWIKDYYEFSVQNKIIETKKQSQKIILCHFPIESWHGKHKGWYHLHGHSHGSLPENPHCLFRVDVGVDVWNYSPVSFEELYKYFKTKEKRYIKEGKYTLGKQREETSQEKNNESTK